MVNCLYHFCSSTWNRCYIMWTGAYWGVLGCSGIYWGILGCTGIYWGELRHIGVYWDVVGYTGIYWDILRWTGAYWGVLGHIGVNWDILGCTEIYWGELRHIGVYWDIMGYTYQWTCPDPIFRWGHRARAKNLVLVMRLFFCSYGKVRRKMTLRSSQDSNLDPLNASQMLLPTEPLKLWHWSRG